MGRVKGVGMEKPALRNLYRRVLNREKRKKRGDRERERRTIEVREEGGHI